MILDESQEERDQELHELTGASLEEIAGYQIAAPENVAIFQDSREPQTEEEYMALYEQCGFPNLASHLRTWMYTSVYRRGEVLLRLLRSTKAQVCLDFGSGVGTHAIALLENANKVDILDVDGPLMQFALKRIRARGLEIGFAYKHSDALMKEKYDLIICTNVLEHCYNPMEEMDRIKDALKSGGKLFLEVSRMIKPTSGHFNHSIKEWSACAPRYLFKYFNNEGAGVFIKR